MSVPVTLIDDQVIVGFDRAGLESALAHQKPSLGIKAADAAAKGSRPGALVGEVHRGSPGEQAGLRPGDIIIEAEGQKIWGASDLGKTIGFQGRGKTISLTVMRGEERLVLRAPL
ncbi:MAG: PDZ domain-containing protein [Dehalococcoidia bacterium]|nr:PDZ domain-containing protein [Dehalococcoidia bacterium]